MWARLRSAARALVGRRRFEDDLSDELAFHLQSRTDHWIAQGLTAGEAARRARLEFGSPDKHAEACRDSRGLRLIDELVADLRYGVRQLRRAPAFTLIATLTLALAIGANAAIFSLVDAVLIKTLPVPEPSQLRQLSWVASRNDTTSLWNGIWYNGNSTLRGPSELAGTSFSYLTCDAIRRNSTVFSDVLCLGHIEQVNLGVGGRAMLGRGQLVPGNFFSGLALGLHIGHAIGPDDDRLGQAPVAVLGYGFWERALGGDPAVLGRTLIVNGVTVTVIGVAARGFTGLQPGEVTDVFLPLTPLQPAFYDEPDMLSSQRYWNWLVVGRLKPGADADHARRETEQFLRQELMARPSSATLVDMPRIELSAFDHGFDRLRESFGKPLRLLGLIVGAVLLIACANIAGLLLTRASARQREFATRLSLGAGRGRLIRQMLTESALLVGLGGVVGIALAFALRQVLPAALNDSPDPLMLDMSADVWLVVFSAAICAFTAIACGVLPAIRAPRAGLRPALARAASTNATAAPRFWTSKALVAVQVTISVLLLVGAGLFVRTLSNLRGAALGFRADHLLLFEMNGTLNGYKDERLQRFYDEVYVGVSAIPGVTSASLSRWGLLSGSHTADGVKVPGRKDAIRAAVHNVFPGYFKTMGVPLLQGRDISDADTAAAPLVVIVNRAMAAKAFGNESALGRTLQLGDKPLTVVGLAADARFDDIRTQPEPTVYVPFRQHGQHVATFALRTAGDPADMIPAVEKTVARIAPDVPPYNIRTQEQQIDDAVRRERLFASLVSGFAVIGALLACLGIYGTLAYSVTRRTSEIGLRVALGARSASVVWLILRESVWPVVAGLAAGLGGALALTRLVESMLFGLTPQDPVTYAIAAVLLLVSAIVAAWIPSRRAAALDPMTVLRCE
jgi:predicted permease